MHDISVSLQQESAGSPIKRVLIVGLGQAGLRFLRACLAFNSERRALEIVGLVEANEKNRALVSGLGFSTFGDVASAARVGKIDLAIVTVPEDQHFSVLLELKRYFPGPPQTMCEKPLTSSLSEAQALRAEYPADRLTLNFVERFSPIVGKFLKFRNDQHRRVLRASSFWGKYRLKDPRSTMGALSDLSHPLDLVLLLSNTPTHTGYVINAGMALKSNFNYRSLHGDTLETVHVAMTFEPGMQYLAASSYLWSRRSRRIELLLADGSGNVSELAVLEFDTPAWDTDKLTVYDVRHVAGEKRLIFEWSSLTADSPPELQTIRKVHSFLTENVNWMDGKDSQLLADLEHGIYVQEILEKISGFADSNHLCFDRFAEPRQVDSAVTFNKIATLKQMIGGRMIDAEHFNWDDIY